MSPPSLSPDILHRAFEVANLRLEKSFSLDEIAKYLGVSSSTVYRLLRLARDRGIIKETVVSLDELPDGSEVPLEDVTRVEEDLERALGLRKAVVLGVPSSLSGKERFRCKLDDDLTRRLGHGAARYLGAILRDQDILGVGAGRSVYFTAVALEEMRRHSQSITVVSMAGGLGVYPFDDAQPSLVSADTSSVLFAHALRGRRVMRNQRPAYDAPDQDQEWSWDPKPNIAVLGVGAIATGIHNCFDQMRHELDDEGRQLADTLVKKAELIRDELKKSRRQPLDPLYFPLADILARPFVVAPPRSVVKLVGSAPIEDLSATASEMARRVYATPPDRLAEIEHVILVAGGARKAFPIWHLLAVFLGTQSSPWHHSLVTDYWTANDLLAIAQGMLGSERPEALALGAIR